MAFLQLKCFWLLLAAPYGLDARYQMSDQYRKYVSELLNETFRATDANALVAHTVEGRAQIARRHFPA